MEFQEGCVVECQEGFLEEGVASRRDALTGSDEDW